MKVLAVLVLAVFVVGVVLTALADAVGMEGAA